MGKSEKINVKLTKSLIGASKKQIAILESLGLRKIGQVRVQPKNAATQGKLKKVIHMVEFG